MFDTATLRHLALLTLLLPYLISGLLKLRDFSGAKAEVAALLGPSAPPQGSPDMSMPRAGGTRMRRGRLPVAPVAAAVIALQLGGSALLLTGGRWAWLGGVALAGFTVIATFVAHTWWHLPAGRAREHAFSSFWEHIALAGALVLASLVVDTGARP